jgi:hypothetical protein
LAGAELDQFALRPNVRQNNMILEDVDRTGAIEGQVEFWRRLAKYLDGYLSGLVKEEGASRQAKLKLAKLEIENLLQQQSL